MFSLRFFVDFSTIWLFSRTPKTLSTIDCLDTLTLFCNNDLDMATSERGCCVFRCGRSRADNTILHSFPNPNKDMERYLAWIEAVGSNLSTLDPQYVYKNRRICHAHFETKYLTWSRRLSPGAIPTLLLPGSQLERVPMMDITNKDQNVIDTSTMEIAIPSTSTDGTSASKVLRPLNLQQRPRKLFTDSKQALKMHIIKLQKKNDSYATRLKKALKLSENKTFQNALNKFSTLAALFTVMQFRKIGKHKMGRRFTESEKIMALSLYKRSPSAYRWLKKIFVLPSPLTLTRLIAKANLKPGINDNIFRLLKKRTAKMKPDEKLCMLLFDEMAIAPHFDYNQRKDIISGFVSNGKKTTKNIADHALVFMIRGIKKNYKQPVAYTFCSGSTKKEELVVLIKDVIKRLHGVGLRVLATVCDQGASNVAAINYLINETRSIYLKDNKDLRRDIFEVDGEEVIPLYDPPHLIKGIRNNLLTKDLKCKIDNNTKTAKWDHIRKLYQEDPAYKGIRLIKKLTEQHINPDKFQKMKVKLATQALSEKVAVTMGFLAENNILPQECAETADIILFFDKLFDSLNGSFENCNKRSGKVLLCAVTSKSEHRDVWKNAKRVLSSMTFVNNDSKVQDKQVTVPTINNWLRTINNVEYLIDILFDKYSIKSVWMRHFNQDPLENFFGMIRSHGCRNTNPTPAGFESSFASLLINNLSGQHSPGSNCEEDSCQIIFKSMNTLFETTNVPVSTEEVPIELDTVFVEFNEKIKNPRILAQLQYVTGYMLKKAKQNVYKNCLKCIESFYDKECSSKYLQFREYKKGKFQLTYPNEKIIFFFSHIQDLITHILKSYSTTKHIKNYLKTLLYVELNFDLFECEEHKSQTIEYMLELSCMFFICNWCRNVNKILNGGTTLDVQNDDNVKVMAYKHFVKKKHNKK